MRCLPVTALRVVLLVALLTLLPAAPAWAHADLLESTPADNTVVATAPARMTLHYSGPVSTTLGSGRVLAPDGSRVDTGQVSTSDNGRTLIVPLRDGLPDGTYTLLWRVLSADDNHVLTGALTFSVKEPSPTAAVAQVQQTDGGAAKNLLALTRLVLYAGLVLLVGGLAFLFVLWPAGQTVRAARRMLWIGWALTGLASAAGLMLQGPYVTGRPVSSALDPALVLDVLGTRYGLATLVRLSLLVGAALLLLRLGRVSGRAGRSVLATAGTVLSIGVLLSTSAVGHAAAGDGATLAVPADALHLAAMSAWIGGLVLLASVLLRRHPSDLAVVLPRWSRYAAANTTILVVTGTFAGWREVGESGALTGTTYGRLLLLKTAIVAFMLALGAVGWLWVRKHYLLPVAHAAASLAVIEVRPAPTPPAVTRLRRFVLLEAGTAAVVLSVTAVLVATTPARIAYAPVLTQTAQVSGALRVQVAIQPARAGLNDMHLSYTEGGKAVDVQQVAARWTLEGGDDVVRVELSRTSLGQYERLRVTLPTAGTWQLYVTSRTSDIDAVTTRFTVRVR